MKSYIDVEFEGKTVTIFRVYRQSGPAIEGTEDRAFVTAMKGGSEFRVRLAKVDLDTHPERRYSSKQEAKQTAIKMLKMTML